MVLERNFQPLPECRFHLGRVSATPGAILALEENQTLPDEFLLRHHQGDWGNVSETDRAENEFAIGRELRIWSVYQLPVTGETLWVITEADRSRTTLLLPDEY